MDSGLSWAKGECIARITGRLQDDEWRVLGMSRANFEKFIALGSSRDRDFQVTDAAVEVGEQRCGFRRHNGGFEIGTGEGAYHLQRAPRRFDEDVRTVASVLRRNCGGNETVNAAKFGQNVFG